MLTYIRGKWSCRAYALVTTDHFSYIPEGPAQVGIEYTHGQLYTYMFRQRSPTETQTPTYWNLMGRSMTPPTHLCYGLLVSFRCHRFIALQFPQRKIRRAAQHRRIRLRVPGRLKKSTLKRIRGTACLLWTSAC
jgi:hypothetical protein